MGRGVVTLVLERGAHVPTPSLLPRTLLLLASGLLLPLLLLASPLSFLRGVGGILVVGGGVCRAGVALGAGPWGIGGAGGDT